jgi:hypothetical protein
VPKQPPQKNTHLLAELSVPVSHVSIHLTGPGSLKGLGHMLLLLLLWWRWLLLPGWRLLLLLLPFFLLLAVTAIGPPP